LQATRRHSSIASRLLGTVVLGSIVAGAGAYLFVVRPALPLVPAPEQLSATALEQPPPLPIAAEAFNQGDWRTAEEAYGRAIAAEPSSAVPEIGLARVLTFQYRFKEAIPHARRAVEVAPRDASAYAVLAQALDWSGDVDGAAAAARRSIDIAPNFSDGHAFLAEVFVDRYQLADARRELDRALALDADGVEPLRVRAYLLETEGRYADAASAYQEAIDVAPRFAHLHFSLGSVYRAMSRWEDALDSYRAAAALAPTDARPVTGLGMVFLSQEDYSAAISYFQQAIALDPGYSTPYGQMGNAYYTSGDYVHAEEPLAKAVEIEQNPLRLSSYKHVLGWTYLRKGSLDSAEREFRGALDLTPNLEGARQGLAAVATARQTSRS
jgi:protein O-GlcNAc transferase